MPVPDYENDLVFPPRHDKTAYELQLENNKLRSLLRECGRRIKDFIEESSYHYDEAEDLLARTNAAIGESEE